MFILKSLICDRWEIECDLKKRKEKRKDWKKDFFVEKYRDFVCNYKILIKVYGRCI